MNVKIKGKKRKLTDGPVELSRKVLFSVLGNTHKILTGDFTEDHLKCLMIDLRELANEMNNNPSPNLKDNLALERFLEACDFVAHTNKNRGIITEQIEAHADKIASALRNPNENGQISIFLQEGVSANQIVHGLFITLGVFLRRFDLYGEDTIVDAFVKHGDDIALCIISILQDSRIRLMDNKGWAILYIAVFENRYGLYCRLHEFKIELPGVEGAIKPDPQILRFPVILTGAKDTDHVLLDAATDEAQLKGISEPKLIETCRGEDRKLHVRLCEELLQY